MKVLSVNAGSSSLKFTLFEMPAQKELVSGNFEKIALENSFYTIKLNGEKIQKEISLTSHRAAFELLVQELVSNNIVSNLTEIEAIAHRIVHGGAFFKESALATAENIQKVEELAPLAPLHNPAALVGLRSAMEIFPNAAQTLVFDTAFHQTMAKSEYLYAVPYEWYTNYGVRKYGFHGTSHKYVSLRANEILGKTDSKLIICHLGNGASISAIKDGKCIATSMGMTPNAGLVMGTRCGDIDATLIPFIMAQTGKTIAEIDSILNKQSGLLAISGVSNDARDVEDGIFAGDERCTLAMEMLTQRVVDYVAEYYVKLEGCDMLVFTAGLGERSTYVRELVCKKLACLGVEIDAVANEAFGKETKLNTENSKVAVYIIPTNEELMLAVDAYNLVK